MANFSGRLSKAPVIYALCQIRFPPILKMGEMVADIQEKLRDQYEGFEEERLTGIQVPPQGQPTIQGDVRWRFESSDKRSGYILQNGSLVYHTTAYRDFDQFVREVLRGFEVAAAIAKIQRVHRIGLRYVDLIEGDDTHTAEQFLHPQLRGFDAELEDVRERLSQYVFAGATSLGQLVIRVTRARHEIILPPDLLPLALVVERKPSAEKPSVFLDTDHFTERADSPIDRSDVEGVIRDLKTQISSTFKKAITDEALAAWK